MKNIGTKFNLRVYSTRWGHHDNYHLTKTEEGWLVTYNKASNAPCDKSGSPTLEKALRGENISYPADLEYFISDIWDASENRSAEEVQSYFDKLSAWISEAEKTKPNFSPLHL
ncbi:hypothetical protein P5654_003925 [Bacillus safensis]|uniref:hypothetical protein n=1 Tax=Bacillus safensis TaxID=561879 RepID=UPI002481DF36|nr:hypothetical protein [Bacillus safensis]MDI0188904.1 hypothetical protein [Bacillus safensis]